MRPTAIKILALIICTICLATCTSKQPDRLHSKAPSCLRTPGQITAMTYNIRSGLGLRSPGKNPLFMVMAKHDVAPVIAAITSIDPDVVALQEVLGPAQARKIADALGMELHFTFHPSPIPWWGNAVLSRCPIIERAKIVTSTGFGDGKSMPLTQIQTPETKISLSSVHRDRQDNTGEQLETILAAVAQKKTPVILMGDFNFRPNDARYAIVSKNFTDTAKAVNTEQTRRLLAQGSFPSKSVKRLDYIFTSSDALTTINAGLTSEAHQGASDHDGVWAQIKLPETESQTASQRTP